MNSNTAAAIKEERVRHHLAKSERYEELLKTYKRPTHEINNKNTGVLWDKLNKFLDVLSKSDPMTRDRLTTISSWLKSKKGVRKVLNIGFGPANLEEIVLKRNTRYGWYGIDISLDSVVAASKKFPTSSFSRQSVTKIAYPTSYFDAVIALEVIEHISPRDTFKALSEINRILNTNGYLFLSLPLNEGLEKMLSKGENPNAHVRIYTPDLITSELKISGFQISRKKYLYAFNNLYRLKTLVARASGMRSPNNLIIESRKR